MTIATDALDAAASVLVSATLEAAACKIEQQQGNPVYRKAWKVAARLVREMKPG